VGPPPGGPREARPRGGPEAGPSPWLELLVHEQEGRVPSAEGNVADLLRRKPDIHGDEDASREGTP